MDGTEEMVPVQVYRNTSGAALLERDFGPRLDARKEDKGKRNVAKVMSEFAGAVGRQDTLPQIAPRGVGRGV